MILYLTMSGALALNFAFSGIPFTLTASQLTGDHFVQYAVPDQLVNNTSGLLQPGAQGLLGLPNEPDNVRQANNGNWYASDSVTQIRNATITGLNQTVCAPVTIIPGLGNLRLHILGSGTTTASSLTIQAPALKAASADFTNINIGTTVAQGLKNQNPGSDPYGATNPANPLGNAFAQDADSVTLKTISQLGVGTEAGTFSIGGLNLWAEFTDSCP